MMQRLKQSMKADVMCWYIFAVILTHDSRVTIAYVTLNLIIIDLGRVLLLDGISGAHVSEIWVEMTYFF